MNRNRLLDLFVVSIWSFSVVVIGFYIKPDTFTSKAFILGCISILPSVSYMFYRKKKNWKKIFLGSLVFGILLGHLLEYIAHKSLMWQCKSLVFNDLILGTSTYDCTIGHGLMVLYMLTFYEHFLDRDIKHFISKKVLLVIFPALAFALLFYFFYILNIKIPFTSYPYLVIGVIAVIPLIYLSIKNPKIMTKLLFIGTYFFTYYFIFELLAVYKSYWIYPGNNYVGWVQILHLRFPFEEMFFWMMLYASTIVSYYELFIDDGR